MPQTAPHKHVTARPTAQAPEGLFRISKKARSTTFQSAVTASALEQAVHSHVSHAILFRGGVLSRFET